jgi:sterol desaturase/sphingolipid hydroxylase (fatty acid hydroxylase superfamily)
MSQLVHLVCWFCAMVVLMSIIEHQVHSRLMHKMPRHSAWRNFAARRRIFTSHAVEHHRQYRERFHDDPVPHGTDRGIRLNVREGLLESLPVSIVLGCFSTTGAIMFPVVVCLHHVLWNQIHLEMHKPAGRSFARWAAFKCVARHHYLHHRYPDKNFNVALPVGDYLFGTVAKPTAADWQAMRAEGIA